MPKKGGKKKNKGGAKPAAAAAATVDKVAEGAKDVVYVDLDSGGRVPRLARNG